MQFAVNVGFAHAAGDQLGNLRAEVEDEDFVLGHGGNFAKCKKTVRPIGKISNLNHNKKRPSETADYTIVQTAFIGQNPNLSSFYFVCFSGIISLRESNSRQPNTTMPMASSGER